MTSVVLAAVGGEPGAPPIELPAPPVFQDTPVPADRESDLANWLIIAGYAQVFDPRTAGFDELMASGSLSVIRDTELRSRIVRHYLQMEDTQESNRLYREDGLALRDALESTGLVHGDWLADSQVISRLRRSDRAVASLRRTYIRAQEQTLVYPRLVEVVRSFRHEVEAALASM